MSTDKPFTLHLGDCRDVLKTLPENSIDAVVTDPPYGLSFMGKGWDHGVPGVDFWREVYRVMKPGAHLIAYGGTRTVHRLTVGIEDAGFEIRDSIYWLYGSGFPKSHNVSKAIDAHLGLEREIVGSYKGATNIGKKGDGKMGYAPGTEYPEVDTTVYMTAPASPEAAQWDGWGTALKPAVEPAVLARKPLSGTVAQNVLQYGTGGINIDGCRVGTSKEVPKSGAKIQNGHSFNKSNPDAVGSGFDPNTGRWPSNILLDEEAAELLDQQSGETLGTGKIQKQARTRQGWMHTNAHFNAVEANSPDNYGDSGGASRFFYIAKASSSEREIGLEGITKKSVHIYSEKAQGPLPKQTPSVSSPRANHHPTVKPLQLMQYMIRLITPPGGTVLDPFMGSGSTGAAAMLERCQFVGIDITPDYIDIAQRRISYWRERSYTPIIDAPVNVPKSIIKPVHSAQQTLDLED